MNKPKSKNKLGGLIKMTRYLKLFVLIALVILLVSSHPSAFDSSTVFILPLPVETFIIYDELPSPNADAYLTDPQYPIETYL